MIATLNIIHYTLYNYTTHSLTYLEFAAELFLDEDFSRAFLKLLALLSSLLKLFTLVRLGLALRGLSRGELGGRGDLIVRGDGDLEGLKSWKSKGLGDLETAGVERGESSLISQYSSLISDKQNYLSRNILLSLTWC